jgi:hypothetical protein
MLRSLCKPIGCAKGYLKDFLYDPFLGLRAIITKFDDLKSLVAKFFVRYLGHFYSRIQRPYF